MINLRQLHLPKLFTTTLNDSFIQGLATKCPKLIEVGFVIDEDVVALPINELFEKSSTLEALTLKFDLPRSIIETGSESRLPTPSDKLLICANTFSRLKKLVIRFNAEPTFLSWVDCSSLLTECVYLEHMEVVRKLKYRTLAKRNRDKFKEF